MDWKTLIEILGSDNVERIKKTITNEIIDDIHQSASAKWLMLPEEFEDMFDELGREIFEEVKKKYRKELKSVVCEKMEDFINSMKVKNQRGE